MYREKETFSLPQLLKQSAEVCGEKEALRDEAGTVTYHELNRRVTALAAALIESGLEAGDRVAVLFPNSIDYVTAHYAAMAAGGVSVPIDNFITSRNLQFQVEDTGAQFFLYDKSHIDKVKSTALPEFKGIITNGVRDDNSGTLTFELIFTASSETALPEVHSDDRAMILYTTGTTGRQKGVVLTQKNLVVSALNIMERCEVTPDDCELTALPQTRLFGLAHVHGYLSLGARMMLVKNMILPQKVLPLIREIGATSFPHVPTAFYILLDKYPKLLAEYGNELRYILMCSAALKAERYHQMKKLLPNVRLFHSYGLSEAARSTIIELDKHTDKVTAVGTPTTGTTVKIVKDDEVQPTGVEGEVVIEGPIVTSGYWHLPEENARVLTKHGFHTGDLGMIDEEGLLHLVGRIKDIINVSGLKVNPMEIEDVLIKIPEVKDAAVVGFPDDKGSFNEKIVAFIVTENNTELDAQSIRQFCLKELEPFKIPLHFEKIDVIPRTVSGKLQRVKLREGYSF